MGLGIEKNWIDETQRWQYLNPQPPDTIHNELDQMNMVPYLLHTFLELNEIDPCVYQSQNHQLFNALISSLIIKKWSYNYS